MEKLFVIALALFANLGIQYYAHQAGQSPSSGTFLGMEYSSAWAAASVFTLRFLWLLFIVNVATALASRYGQTAFSSYVVFILVFISIAPISVFIYNAVVTKEAVNWLHIAGVLLVIAGAMAIAANKTILDWLN